jgi:hypothetical protein
VALNNDTEPDDGDSSRQLRIRGPCRVVTVEGSLESRLSRNSATASPGTPSIRPCR